jgi:hypothetical protein
MIPNGYYKNFFLIRQLLRDVMPGPQALVEPTMLLFSNGPLFW